MQWLFASELFSTARLKRMEDEDLALYEAVVGLEKMGLSNKSVRGVSLYIVLSIVMYIYSVLDFRVVVFR